MRVYISGKITGLDPKQAMENFTRAEIFLHRLELKTVNPVALCNGLDPNESWETYMKRCIPALVECDAIYLLENWKDSRGARLEAKIASALGLIMMR